MKTNTKWKINLQSYHPLDKTKKLSQKKAKFRTLTKFWPNLGKMNNKNINKKEPWVGFKAGESWVRCVEGKTHGRIGFKLKCHDEPGPNYGKLTFHDWKTDAIVGKKELDDFNCKRDHAACLTPAVPSYAVKVDCKGRFCKPICQQGYTAKDSRRYKCGNDFKWSVAGKHVSNLPDCITCKNAHVHIQPDVLVLEIKDPTKSRKIGDGKGLIELRVLCSSPNMVLHFNGKNYPGIMTKPEPYKRLVCKCSGPLAHREYDRECKWKYGRIVFEDKDIQQITCTVPTP